VKTFASARGASVSTIFKIIHKDLGLAKKSARWVPKMLSQEQQEDLGRHLQDGGKQLRSILDNIITIIDCVVSMNTL
jgi:hypothetical protein